MKEQMDTPAILILYSSRGKEYFFPGQIIRLEAKSNYTKIYFDDHFSIVTAKVLKQFEPLLTPFGFIRIHRSHLINRKFIRQVLANGRIIMNDSSVTGISKRKKVAVMKSLLINTICA